MLLGPVFRAELLRTTRRRDFYALRLTHGCVLLILLWVGYRASFKEPPTIASVAQFAERASAMIVLVQAWFLLVMVPPLFAGTIAGEKQRRTLHYLMGTPLSSAEIVLDKVLGRLPLMAVFLGVSFPVISILGLFGGVSGLRFVLAYAATVSTFVFAIALTVLVSTLARRVRDAMLIAYVLLIGWLVVPSLIHVILRFQWPAAYYWIAPINDPLKDSSPLGVWFQSRIFGLGGGPNADVRAILWMIEIQMAMAAALFLLAVWRLRPVFRRETERGARRLWFAAWRRRVRRARPQCGDDPVFWRERYFTVTSRGARLVLVPTIVVVTLILMMVTESQGRASQVFRLLWTKGYAWEMVPDNFLWALRVDFGWFVAFWLVAVASACASSVAGEREADTWGSLTSTPLTGWEIVRGKVLAAIWNRRALGRVLLAIWLVGLITGYMHPLGILLSAALVALLTWLVAMIGIHASIRARSTSAALGSTVGVLWLLNLHPAILLLWFLGSLGWESSFSVLGAMPWLAVGPLGSYGFVSESWRVAIVEGVRFTPSSAPVYFGLILLAIYGVVAALFTWRIIRRFDLWLERPRLTDTVPINAVAARSPRPRPGDPSLPSSRGRERSNSQSCGTASDRESS